MLLIFRYLEGKVKSIFNIFGCVNLSQVLMIDYMLVGLNTVLK